MSILFQAEFTGAANTSLSAYTPEVGTFGTPGANLELNGSGYLRCDTAAEQTAPINPTTAVSDFLLRAVLQTGNDLDYTTVRFRQQDATNFLGVECEPNGTINLISIIADVYSVIASYATGKVDADIDVAVLALGTDIRVFIDGVQRIRQTVSSFSTATIFGLRFGEFGAGSSGLIGRIEIRDWIDSQVLRPDGTVSNTNWTASASTAHGDTSDESDSTHVEATADDAVVTLAIANPAPAFSALDAVLLTVRAVVPDGQG